MLSIRLLHRCCLPSQQLSLFKQSRSFSRSARSTQQQHPPPAPPPQAPRAPPPRRSNSQQLPLLPLVVIFCLGSGSFYYLLKSREGLTHNTYTAGEKAPPKEQRSARRRDTEQ